MNGNCADCVVASHLNSPSQEAATWSLGVPHREVVRLLTGVTDSVETRGGCDPYAPEVAAERFARAALATAVEPGDVDAGRLVAGLSAVGLVNALVDGWSAATIADRLQSAGGDRGDVCDLVAGVPSARRKTEESLARWRARLTLPEAVRALERAAHVRAALCTPSSPQWPAGLESLEYAAPFALWARGDAERLLRVSRSVALVGARASTSYGEHLAMESAAGLADRGFAVVSGGAYGIDAAAHRATLTSGGLTVAFLAGGVDRLYPAGNNELLRRIAHEGVVIAELPPGSAPTRWRFLMRNRLIAAASGATVVIEAGRRSGSLNTAGHAAEMGRPLGAVPGSVLSPASAGCHRLIREYAATCVTTVDEMAELADPVGSPTPPVAPAAEDASHDAGEPDSERTVLSALSGGPATADEIAAGVALPFSTVAAVLGRLELSGAARESGAGWTTIERRRS
jgi:DNA processing protein